MLHSTVSRTCRASKSLLTKQSSRLRITATSLRRSAALMHQIAPAHFHLTEASRCCPKKTLVSRVLQCSQASRSQMELPQWLDPLLHTTSIMQGTPQQIYRSNGCKVVCRAKICARSTSASLTARQSRVRAVNYAPRQTTMRSLPCLWLGIAGTTSQLSCLRVGRKSQGQFHLKLTCSRQQS